MGKDKQKDEEKKNCSCSSDCTCGETCDCTPEHKCHEDCTCGEHEHDCGCKDGGECSCGETCECGDDCSCHDQGDIAEQFKMYQKAFDQFEEALEKVDAELTKEREKSARAEHLADTYKKDLERYKERNRDIEQESKVAASIKVAEKILPVLDNFEQALKTVKDENVLVGFKMIQTGIKNILADMGIAEMKDEVGKAFDPAFHDAVNRIEIKDKKLDGTVANVYKTGYYLASDNTKVIRHAQVEIYVLK